MLRNVSYGDRKTRQEIDALVGRSYSFLARIKMGGIGSPKLKVLDASPLIKEELRKDNDKNLGYGELRPNGLIIYFRSILESWALVIPFTELSIRQEATGLKIEDLDNWLRIKLSNKVHIQSEFFKKVVDKKIGK